MKKLWLSCIFHGANHESYRIVPILVVILVLLGQIQL